MCICLFVLPCGFSSPRSREREVIAAWYSRVKRNAHVGSANQEWRIYLLLHMRMHWAKRTGSSQRRPLQILLWSFGLVILLCGGYFRALRNHVFLRGKLGECCGQRAVLFDLCPVAREEKGPGWGCDGCGQDGSGKERYRCEEGGISICISMMDICGLTSD